MADRNINSNDKWNDYASPTTKTIRIIKKQKEEKTRTKQSEDDEGRRGRGAVVVRVRERRRDHGYGYGYEYSFDSPCKTGNRNYPARCPWNSRPRRKWFDPEVWNCFTHVTGVPTGYPLGTPRTRRTRKLCQTQLVPSGMKLISVGTWDLLCGSWVARTKAYSSDRFLQDTRLNCF